MAAAHVTRRAGCTRPLATRPGHSRSWKRGRGGGAGRAHTHPCCAFTLITPTPANSLLQRRRNLKNEQPAPPLGKLRRSRRAPCRARHGAVAHGGRAVSCCRALVGAERGAPLVLLLPRRPFSGGSFIALKTPPLPGMLELEHPLLPHGPCCCARLALHPPALCAPYVARSLPLYAPCRCAPLALHALAAARFRPVPPWCSAPCLEQRARLGVSARSAAHGLGTF